MTMRIVERIHPKGFGPECHAIVRRDSETGEFCSTFYNSRAEIVGTYYTEDRADAIGTAKTELERMEQRGQ